MAAEKLTAVQVKTKKPGRYGDGKGLWLVVGKASSRSWVFRYMVAGRSREMGLGPCSDVSLAEAREEARRCRRLIREGIDPIEDRRAAHLAQQLEGARAMSLRECAAAYIAVHQSKWSNEKHRKQWAKTFLAVDAYVPSAIGRLSVAAIDDAIAVKVLLPLWEATPATAGRVRQRLESVIDWATASKFRSGLNPARWSGHLEYLLPKGEKRVVAHHAALPYAEIAAFMAELREQTGTAARALEFLILTAARTGEVLGAVWDEIDERQKLWSIPAARMKAGVEHQVPLSDAALAILGEMRQIRQSEVIFEGARPRRPLSHAAMTRLLAAMGRGGGLTVHGFRSAFRDWCGDKTTFPREIAEAALAHKIGGVEGSYRRGKALEKRAQLMAAWAGYCARPAVSGNVVRLTV